MIKLIINLMIFSKTNKIKNNLADKIFNSKHKTGFLIIEIILQIIINKDKEESSVEIKNNKILFCHLIRYLFKKTK